MSDDLLPPDRADEAPVTAPLRELMHLLKRTPDHQPSIEIECDPDSYDKLRAYFARPYRAQPTTFCLPVGGGTAWFRRASAVATEQRPSLRSAEVSRKDPETPVWLQARIDSSASVSSSARSSTRDGLTYGADYGGPWKGDKA